MTRVVYLEMATQVLLSFNVSLRETRAGLIQEARMERIVAGVVGVDVPLTGIGDESLEYENFDGEQ